jgi:hypothetical protein
MPSGDVIGSVAYTLSFALVETLIVLLIVLLAGMVVPRQWVVEKYVPWASALLVELAIMAIVFQNAIIHHLPKRNLVIAFALILAVSTIVVLRFPKMGDVLKWISERLIVLSFIYIFFDILGFLIVIVRNV